MRQSTSFLLSLKLFILWSLALSVYAEEPALVQAVESIGMTVSNMDRSVDFYSRVLSFEKIADVEVSGEPYERLTGVFGARIRQVTMKLGDEVLVLTEFLTPKGRPHPEQFKSNDHMFQHIAIVVSDMKKAYAVLRKHNVEHASTAPQRLPDWNPNAAGIEAFYFKDPDGHHLEIIQFPKGKGQAKWRKKSDALFLGIDHTAIVVSDTEKSLKFYRDILGLKIAGTSENYGPEQEHLNNVFGARLRITALQAERGPGIEFLEYLTPRTGKPTPADSQPNDLWHWQINLQTNHEQQASKILRKKHYNFISSQVVHLPHASLGYKEALLVRDPDGHPILLADGFTESNVTQENKLTPQEKEERKHWPFLVPLVPVLLKI